jgi:hypothetical protein
MTIHEAFFEVPYLIAENCVPREKGMKLQLDAAIEKAADGGILPRDLRDLSAVI